jgi:Ca2+-binding EF-hand superfamily protein
MTSKKNNAIEDTNGDQSFDLLFGRFRVMILSKHSSSRTSDLNKNNVILKGVFSKLYDAVNKKTGANRPGLNLIEFKISVHKLYPGFTLDEVKRLFLYFDADRSGRISAEEFIIGIKGRLNDYRQSLIDFVFHLLDTNCNGFIEEKELTEYLKQTHMPGIVTGKNLPPEKKSRELIKKIGCEGASSNAISLKDLQEFYVDRGVFTTDDIMFKYEVLDDWLFSEELCDLYLKNETQNFKPQKAAESSGLKRYK